MPSNVSELAKRLDRRAGQAAGATTNRIAEQAGIKTPTPTTENRDGNWWYAHLFDEETDCDSCNSEDTDRQPNAQSSGFVKNEGGKRKLRELEEAFEAQIQLEQESRETYPSLNEVLGMAGATVQGAMDPLLQSILVMARNETDLFVSIMKASESISETLIGLFADSDMNSEFEVEADIDLGWTNSPSIGPQNISNDYSPDDAAVCVIPFYGQVACGTAIAVYAAGLSIVEMYANPCSLPNYREDECDAIGTSIMNSMRSAQDTITATLDGLPISLNPDVVLPGFDPQPNYDLLDDPNYLDYVSNEIRGMIEICNTTGCSVDDIMWIQSVWYENQDVIELHDPEVAQLVEGFIESSIVVEVRWRTPQDSASGARRMARQLGMSREEYSDNLHSCKYGGFNVEINMDQNDPEIRYGDIRIKGGTGEIIGNIFDGC